MSTSRLADATVAIVGVGLMGGSLALALRERAGMIIGVEVNDAAAREAVAAGVVDQVMTLAEAAARSDVLVLAAPVGVIVRQLGELAKSELRDGLLVTDLGSTKVDVCAVMDELPDAVAAIGGHPMCGRVHAGIAAAEPALFHGARWAVCPTARTTPAALALLDELIDAAGAEPMLLDAVEHDAAVATVSHLPFVVAHALVAARDRADVATHGAASRLASTGFAGATRLAAGDVTMWRDILSSNTSHVRDAIELLRGELARLGEAIDTPEELAQLFAHHPH